ncbi:MAG: SH3 domain-containing protein [Pyrinomonadaceae bacterium]
MKQLGLAALAAALSFIFVSGVDAQRRIARVPAKSPAPARAPEVGKYATVVDELLSVLRPKPSLFSEPVQRMRLGRKVRILAVAEADGVKFFRVQALPNSIGWVQADAVFGTFRPDDDARMARLVQATRGFEQIELAKTFFELFPDSKFRAPILLLYGDIVEESALRLSRDAARLSRQEMAAGGAPMHSYFLNFNMLDRYRRLGIIFLFNPETKQFHYDGASWREIIAKHPASPEAVEAQRRVDSIKAKMSLKSPQ